MLVNKAVLYPAEAAAARGVSVHIIYRLIHEKRLFAYKDEGGKAWHIPEDAIRDYVASRKASVCSPE